MDDLFRQAVALIDAGDAAALARLLDEHPHLVTERADFGSEKYFQRPYLLWFVAGNPVRNDRLPANIAEIAKLIVDRGGTQVDYALELVSSGRVPREAGVQRALIDVLCHAGANPGPAMLAALAHKERDAVERLLEHGARMNLVMAVCTGRDPAPYLEAADERERQLALTAAAFYGNARALELLVRAGVDVDAYGPQGFHPHATPLHQAVDSGSLESVQVLVDAGARLDIRDRAYDGTPLGWADYLERTAIAAYLREHGSPE